MSNDTSLAVCPSLLDSGVAGVARSLAIIDPNPFFSKRTGCNKGIEISPTRLCDTVADTKYM